MSPYRIAVAGVFAAITAIPTAALSATIAFVPAAGAASDCAMVLKKKVRHGGHEQTYSETWDRRMSIGTAGGGVSYAITYTPTFQKQSEFRFTKKMARAPLTPIDPRDMPGDERDRVVFGFSFPESTIYGRRIAVGGAVEPLPDFRSVYTKEMLDSGLVKESIDRSLALKRVETYQGRSVYVFEGASQHDVALADGSKNTEVASAVMRFDRRTLMLRQATFKMSMEMLDGRDNDKVVHENEAEWRCTLR